MGTPDFAVASLKRLVEDGHEICGVFTQPDRPKNRGHKLAFSPVKEYALAQGLSVYQPTKMRDGTALALVRELHPELIVVAAYGRILPEDILNTPPYGSINVHSSLLPKYRGAAPINWAVIRAFLQCIFIGALLGAFIIPLLPAFFHGHVMLSPGAYTAGAVLGAVTAFAIQYNILDVRGAVSRSMNGGLLDILGPSAIVLLGIWIILHSVRR